MLHRVWQTDRPLDRTCEIEKTERSNISLRRNGQCHSVSDLGFLYLGMIFWRAGQTFTPSISRGAEKEQCNTKKIQKMHNTTRNVEAVLPETADRANPFPTLRC